MSNIAARVGASAAVILGAIYPQIVVAQGFTGFEFATWSELSQNGYLQSSVTMAAFIAAQGGGETATCLDNWYAPGQLLQSERNNELRAAIAQYPEYHPSGVILAVLQQACGAIVD